MVGNLHRGQPRSSWLRRALVLALVGVGACTQEDTDRPRPTVPAIAGTTIREGEPALPAPRALLASQPASAAPATGTSFAVSGPTDAGCVLYEQFVGPFPNASWVLTRDGDFRKATVGVVDERLRLQAGTIGTRDDTVKHLGVRTAEAVVDLCESVEIAADIDWNGQANGCYLRASLFLCPTRTDATASSERDWLKFEYVGVPPGKNGRALLASRKAGQLRHLFTEGWPQEQRKGRMIGRQKVVLRLDATSIEAIENGQSLCGLKPHGLKFRKAYLYIQMSSHSNYPAREVFFDNVTIRALARPAPR